MEVLAKCKKTLIEPGTYAARCYSVVHTGTREYDYQGQKKTSDNIRISFEMPTELEIFNPKKGAQPFTISKSFNLSLAPSSHLRPFLVSWRGIPFTEEELLSFNVAKLVGVECLINIIKGKEKRAIAGVSKLPKGMFCPAAINPPLIYSVNHHDQSIFDSFPEFLKTEIMNSKEFLALKNYSNMNNESEKMETGRDTEWEIEREREDDLPDFMK